MNQRRDVAVGLRLERRSDGHVDAALPPRRHRARRLLRGPAPRPRPRQPAGSRARPRRPSRSRRRPRRRLPGCGSTARGSASQHSSPSGPPDGRTSACDVMAPATAWPDDAASRSGASAAACASVHQRSTRATAARYGTSRAGSNDSRNAANPSPYDEQRRLRRQARAGEHGRGGAEPLLADQPRDGRVVGLQSVDAALHHGVAIDGEPRLAHQLRDRRHRGFDRRVGEQRRREGVLVGGEIAHAASITLSARSACARSRSCQQLAERGDVLVALDQRRPRADARDEPPYSDQTDSATGAS